jgi:hypothetical protein
MRTLIIVLGLSESPFQETLRVMGFTTKFAVTVIARNETCKLEPLKLEMKQG